MSELREEAVAAGLASLIAHAVEFGAVVEDFKMSLGVMALAHRVSAGAEEDGDVMALALTATMILKHVMAGTKGALESELDKEQQRRVTHAIAKHIKEGWVKLQHEGAVEDLIRSVTEEEGS